MKMICNVPDEAYKAVKCGTWCGSYVAEKMIANGTPIPDNATNGDVIKAMFDIKEVDMENTYCVHFPKEEEYSHYFFKDWWNAPYQRGGK